MISYPRLQHFPLAIFSFCSSPVASNRLIGPDVSAAQYWYSTTLAPVLLLPLPETSCSLAPRPRCRVHAQGKVVTIGHHPMSTLRWRGRYGRCGSSLQGWSRRGDGRGSGSANHSMATHSVVEVLRFFKKVLLADDLWLSVQIRVRSDAGYRHQRLALDPDEAFVFWKATTEASLMSRRGSAETRRERWRVGGLVGDRWTRGEGRLWQLPATTTGRDRSRGRCCRASFHRSATVL